MKSENYINIQGWQISKLELKGNELIIYAIIYGFSQDGNSKYRGSLSYIQNALKISKNTVIKSLDSLIEKGLIIKELNNTGNLYSADLQVVQKLHYPSAINALASSAEIAPLSSAESEHNNNIYNNKYINNNIKKKFTKPLLEEIEQYCKERDNKVVASKFFDYYESKGWLVGKTPMKDWKAAVRTWEQNNFDKPNTKVYKNQNKINYAEKLKERQLTS